MAWWRERLEALDEGAAAPPEPTLQAVVVELLPRGVSGEELSRLEDAWLPLLEPLPWGDAQAGGLSLRGRLLFGIGARLLGRSSGEADEAGALWSLIDGEHHCSDRQSREVLSQRASAILAAVRAPIPRQLRVLTVLAALAAADLISEGRALTRLSAAVKHRLMGSLPRG
jgi:hypothetical protein